MKIVYFCEICGALIDVLEVEKVDESKFGFDCLTGQERQDIIKVDAANGSMEVLSLCDECIETMGLAEEALCFRGAAVKKAIPVLLH